MVVRRVVAFEWNSEQLRVVLARISSRGWSVERIWSFNLPTPVEERDLPETPLSAALAEGVQELLSGLSLPRCEVVVLVSRAHVELRQLTLPPAPDEELPDMVRFQASREFTSLEESWPLDFYPLESDPTQPRNVLAVAIPPRLLERIQGVCSRCHLRLARVGIRPFAAASMFLRHQGGATTGAELLVGLFSDEADLTVFLDKRILLSRCTRLHGDPLEDDQAVDDLVGQIRRTIAAAQGLLGARRVETVVLCGAGPKLSALMERLRQELRQQVTLWDLTPWPPLSAAIQTVGADQLAQFFPLFGALEEYAERLPSAVDFLHPRKRPAPPSRRPQILAAITVAALILGGVIIWGYWHDLTLREEIRQLQDRLKTLEARERQTAGPESVVSELARWESQSVNWLEELYRLAVNLPPAQEIMLRQVRCTLGTEASQIEFDGLARSLEAIGQAELRLQGENRSVLGKSKSELPNPQYYRYEFRSGIRIERPAEKPSQTSAARVPAARGSRAIPRTPMGQ
jgi:Tfp pilus assembly PilM family ATPase